MRLRGWTQPSGDILFLTCRCISYLLSSVVHFGIWNALLFFGLCIWKHTAHTLYTYTYFSSGNVRKILLLRRLWQTLRWPLLWHIIHVWLYFSELCSAHTSIWHWSWSALKHQVYECNLAWWKALLPFPSTCHTTYIFHILRLRTVAENSLFWWHFFAQFFQRHLFISFFVNFPSGHAYLHFFAIPLACALCSMPQTALHINIPNDN